LSATVHFQISSNQSFPFLSTSPPLNFSSLSRILLSVSPFFQLLLLLSTSRPSLESSSPSLSHAPPEPAPSPARTQVPCRAACAHAEAFELDAYGPPSPPPFPGTNRTHISLPRAVQTGRTSLSPAPYTSDAHLSTPPPPIPGTNWTHISPPTPSPPPRPVTFLGDPSPEPCCGLPAPARPPFSALRSATVCL